MEETKEDIDDIESLTVLRNHFQVQGDTVDDDGKARRTGTLLTASAHIITAVIGSGVLSLAWAIAQLGWLAGPFILLAFAFITYLTSCYLSDSYRSPDPVTGSRNYTYMDAVKAILGEKYVKYCGLAQYANIIGFSIGYTVTSSISVVAVIRAICFHDNGQESGCHKEAVYYMAAFAVCQVFISQIPNFHKLSFLSIVAAVMSFSYSSIGFGLSVAKVIEGTQAKTTLGGVVIGADVTAPQKVWRAFQAIGNMGFSYAFSPVLIEIQDTLCERPPENKVMKRATLYGIATTTLFYMLCGCFGYAAFGNKAPGNFLTGFGFYEPYWLICIANICIVVHLVGAYQVFCQPLFGLIETMAATRFPNSRFVNEGYDITLPLTRTPLNVNLFRIGSRTLYVIVATLVAMLLPFFNDILGFIGAVSFWPLTVYFPIQMHMKMRNVLRFSSRWIAYQVLIWGCFVVCLLAMIGSIDGIIRSLKGYEPFHVVQ